MVYAETVPPELIIFDCDGVLIDSEAIACRADSACLAEIGIAMSAEEIMDRYLGISADDDVRRHRAAPGPRAAGRTSPRRCGFASPPRSKPSLCRWRVSRRRCDALPQRRCVASSSAPERLRHSLSLAGLLHRFEPHVFSATQVARGKPAPDLFLFAAASMQADPAACVVIEDSVPGVQAAVAAGMRVIGFTGGGHCRPGHAERLLAAGAAAIADDMRRLPALVSPA